MPATHWNLHGVSRMKQEKLKAKCSILIIKIYPNQSNRELIGLIEYDA